MKFSLNQIICGRTDQVKKNPGYHLIDVPKGVFGESSKIVEETFEFCDAIKQGSSVLELVELSDLYGAIQGYLAKHHPSITMADLAKMSDITQRAFFNGHRG